MSGFQTPLRVEWLSEKDDDTPSWKLLDPLVYVSDKLGRSVIIPAGFVTDFASVPRAPVLYFLAGNTGNRAAVVHDFLIHQKEIPRQLADEVFKEALYASGVDQWRADMMYLGVVSHTNSLTATNPPPDPTYLG